MPGSSRIFGFVGLQFRLSCIEPRSQRIRADVAFSPEGRRTRTSTSATGFATKSTVASGLTTARGRVIDTDNAVTGMKPILDSLFVGAITPSDSPAWVEFGGLTQETGKKWAGNEEVEVIVEELT